MGIFDFVGDAWDWAKGAAGSAWDTVTGAANPKAHYSTDPNAFEYGGKAGFANDEADYYRSQAEGAQDRTAPQMDLTNANDARAQGQESRNWELDATRLAHDAAYGKTPSVAQQQMAAGRDDAIRAQMAMAASTRGNPYAVAAAQRNAQYQGANLMQQNIRDTGVLRAQEMATARSQYEQAATQQRAADLQQQGLDADSAYKQAQLEAQQRALNDQRAYGYEQLRSNALGQQQQGQISEEQIASGVAQGDANRRQSMFSGLLGMAGGIAGAAAMGSDASLKTDIVPEGATMGLPAILSDMTTKTKVHSPFFMNTDDSDANMSQGDMLALYGGKGNLAQQMAMRKQFGGGLVSDERSKAAAQSEGMKQGILAALSARGPSQGVMTSQEAAMVAPRRMPMNATAQGRMTAPEANIAYQFADSLQPYSYEYKDPNRSPNGQAGRHLGVMAQDVERAPVAGPQIVQRGPDGAKQLNIPELLSANTAAIADIHQRLKAQEAKPDNQAYMNAFLPAARNGGY
jgi:hypothetical protein